MSVIRYARTMLKGAVLWACLAVFLLFLVMAAICFFATALFIIIAAHLGIAAAAALTGAALLLLALLALAIGSLILRRMRRYRPNLFADASSTIAMLTSLGSMLVRQDPRRAILLSLIAGALTEYFAAPDKPRR